MTKPTESYLTVSYDLRPAKQIERRMLIESLQIMSRAGFDICDYQYTGFGSIYFVDFILFHKYLGINILHSIEYPNKIEKRIRFNKPFANVIVKFGRMGQYIPELDQDIKHFLWLDYDAVMDEEILNDVKSASSVLPRGSILLVTVDSESPHDCNDTKTRMEYFKEIAGAFLGIYKEENFTLSNLPRMNIKILYNAMKNGLAGRSVNMIPLYNFLYKDGHRMLTMGGIIGGDSEMTNLKKCNFEESYYMRTNFEDSPYFIKVPILTRKERIYLDSKMPAKKGWKLTAFELDKESIDSYREIYRFFPSYAELLL